MNPLMNPLMNIATQAKQAQGNPNYIRDLLLKNNRIDQQTYDALNGMSASQMGSYLLDNGMLNHTAIGQMASAIPQIQALMK